MELELAALGEFAEARSEADEVWSCDGDSQTHGGLGDVVDAVAVQAEAVRLVLAVDELDEVAALVCAMRDGEHGLRCHRFEWKN